VAQAVAELHEKDKIHEEIKKIGLEIEQNQEKLDNLKNMPVPEFATQATEPPQIHAPKPPQEIFDAEPQLVPLSKIVRSGIEQQHPVLGYIREMQIRQDLSFMDKKLQK
jgi:hypothetical protein